jgi:hypothetical protein
VAPLCPGCPPLALPDGSRRLAGKRLLLQPVARRRLGTRRAVKIKPPPKRGVFRPQGRVLALKLGHSRLERLDPALKSFDEAANLGGKLHSHLESHFHPADSPKSVSIRISALTVTFRTHPPTLAVTKKCSSRLDSCATGCGRVGFSKPRRPLRAAKRGAIPPMRICMPQISAFGKTLFDSCRIGRLPGRLVSGELPRRLAGARLAMTLPRR